MTMDRDIRDMLLAFIIGLALVLAILLVFGVRQTKAQQPDPTVCPQQAKSCKLITLTPEEEQTLTGADMVFDQALWARQQFGPLLKAWRDKFQNAPAGKPYSGSPATSGAEPAPAPK